MQMDFTYSPFIRSFKFFLPPSTFTHNRQPPTPNNPPPNPLLSLFHIFCVIFFSDIQTSDKSAQIFPFLKLSRVWKLFSTPDALHFIYTVFSPPYFFLTYFFLLSFQATLFFLSSTETEELVLTLPMLLYIPFVHR